MMPKNAKHPPMSAIDTKKGLHAAKSNAGRSAVSIHDEESKPDPVISTDLTLQEDATRDDTRKRKARSTHTMHTTGSERTAKRLKNTQDRPAVSDSEDNPLNDEDRKPAAKQATPTPDGAPSSTCPSNDEDRKPAASTTPTPDGVPSTCAGFNRKSTSTPATESVVSTSTQGIKLEPVIKTETAPANPATSQAEAPIPTEAVSNGPNLNRTVTVCRKVAKRSDPLYIEPPPPQNIAAPLPPTPQAEDIPVTQKPRVEEPLLTITDEATRGIAAPDMSEGLPSPGTPLSAATVDVSTRRRSRCLTQLPPTETSEEELDDSDDDADYVPPPTVNVHTSIRRSSTRRTGTPIIPPSTATLNAPTRRRSYSHVIPTSSTGNPVPPPGTVNADVSTHRQNRRQTRLPSIETSKAQLDDDDNDDDGVLSGPSWQDRLSELADYRKIHGHCNVPRIYSENNKLGHWVGHQRKHYKLHLEKKTSPMTPFRIRELESLGFEWDCYDTAWKDRLSELADYRKIYGHCNVPYKYSENAKLVQWVETQRSQYKLHLEGKTSHMTLSRIQKLESLGFRWDCYVAAWEDRLSELADYHKIHGHCNVPKNYSENTQLGTWVTTQRTNYRLHLEGKKSTMMIALRIQALESLGFEWESPK
jgi:hypothetical protein